MTDLWLWAWVPVLLIVAVAEHLSESRAAPSQKLLRWPTNLALFFIEVSVASAATGLLALSAVWLVVPLPPLIALSNLPGAVGLAVWALVATFTGYWIHRLSHQVPLVWRAHRIHHSDPIVDPSTALRHHPLEIVLAIAVFQIPVALFLPDPAHVLMFAVLERMVAAATHTRLQLPARLEQWIGLIFVTPRQHLTHHSDFQPETDSNYGNVLNIWDRLFFTFRAGPERLQAAFHTGLAEVPADKAANLVAMLALPALGKTPWRDPR